MKSSWEILNEAISEAGEENFKLTDAVPSKSSKDLEYLFYALRWVAGFLGGNLPTPELKVVFNQIDAVSPARVTGESHDWADAGRKFRALADKKYKSSIDMHRTAYGDK